MATLDGKLRDLETKLAGALAQKLPPQVLAEALGQPARQDCAPGKGGALPDPIETEFEGYHG